MHRCALPKASTTGWEQRLAIVAMFNGACLPGVGEVRHDVLGVKRAALASQDMICVIQDWLRSTCLLLSSLMIASSA